MTVDVLSPAQTLRAGLFQRESKGSETSIDSQDWENEQACEERSWTIAIRYREYVSASRFGEKAREEWAKVIADVEAGRIDVLVLYEVSRGDRNMDTWPPFVTACRKAGVLIHITQDDTTYDPRNPGHRKALIDAGSDAEHEVEKLRARSLKGIAKAVRDGKMHGQCPYGYRRRYWYEKINGRQVRMFTQHPDEHAPIVVEIIERIAKREPLLAIARDLNRRGVPTPGWDGIPTPIGLWRGKHLPRIALNPSYAGLRERDGVFHQGNWDGLVSRAMWEDARAVLLDQTRQASPPGRLKWLLSYLMAGACARAEAAAAGTEWVPEVRRVTAQPANVKRLLDRYRCPCGCASIGVIEADEVVTQSVLARLAKPQARALFARDDAELAAARDELAGAEAEARELEAAARAGMRPALIAAADEGIQERLRTAQARVKAASTNAAAMALLGDGKFIAETARPRWDALSVAARRSVITTLVDTITLLPATKPLTRWSSDAERLYWAGERIKIKWVGESD